MKGKTEAKIEVKMEDRSEDGRRKGRWKTEVKMEDGREEEDRNKEEEGMYGTGGSGQTFWHITGRNFCAVKPAV